MSYLFIVNPVATGCPPDIEARIRARFPDSPVWLTERAGDAGRLARRATAEGLGSCKQLIACGGDGTFREVAGQVGRAVTVGMVPLGTVNLVARELKIPLSLDQALQCMGEGQTTLIYPGHCVIDDRAELFFIGVSAGPDADAVHGVKLKLKQRIGKFAYLVSLLQRLRAPVEPTVELQIEEHASNWGQVVVLKMPCYGGAFRLGHHASLTDPDLEVVAVKRGRARVLQLFWDAARGRSLPRPEQVRSYVPRLNLRLPAPGFLQLDGDAFLARRVELYASTVPIRVLCGPSV